MTRSHHHLAEMARIAPAQRDHIPAFRVAVSLAVLLIALLAVDRLDLALYVTFGGFTAIYARHEPPRLRLKHQLQAGGLLLTWISVGLFLAVVQAPPFVVIIACSLVAGIGAMASTVWGLKPVAPSSFC